MRFKKGSKVEVLSKNEVPSGAWCPAEIIVGNGHYYTLRYEMRKDDADEIERVPRKAIRPCPPPSSPSESWAPGDVVEVFENFSWKMAKISKVLDNDFFLVRLLGSSLLFQVSKFDMRVRQSWEDDKWIVIGKGSGSSGGMKNDENLTSNCETKLSSQVQNKKLKIKLSLRDDHRPLEGKRNFKEWHASSSKSIRKRSYSQVEAYAGISRKFRMIEKEGKIDRIVAANPSAFVEQVGGVVSTRKMLDEKHVEGSTRNSTTRCFVSDVDWRKQDGAVGCSLAENLESNDTDSSSSSVGSCSISGNGYYEFPHYLSSGPGEDADDHSSDAESCCGSSTSERTCLIPSKEDLAAEIHRLELHAYRCTIEKLHASGPLSWEQEAMMTNLRLSLNISNEEHLMEIKNLISMDNSTSLR